MRFLRSLLSFGVILSGIAGATAEDAPTFFLDLDTGGHRAFVKEVAFAPDGETLVSASDDKTIRIWDWRTGATLRTLRGFIGEGNEGKIFALAVSPDGKTIAAGGYFGPGLGEQPPYGDIRLFDFASGQMTGVLKAAQYAVYDLAFSSDGQYLASGGQDDFVFVWKRDGSGNFAPHTRLDTDSIHVEKLAFAAAGTRLAATTTDYGIRLWDFATGERIDMPEAAVLEDVSVMAMAVSPDGKMFATGSAAGDIHLWNTADGKLAATGPKQEFLIGSLVFADGGKELVVSCGYRCSDKFRTVVWRVGDPSVAREYRGHDGTVYASAPSPDGKLVATAGGTRHAIHVWDPLTGERKGAMEGQGHPATAVGIDDETLRIAWGTANPCPASVSCPEIMGALETTLALPRDDRFFENPTPADDAARFRRATLAENGLTLETAPGGNPELETAILEIIKDGTKGPSIENDATNGYLHAAFSLFADGTRLVTGGNDGTLMEYDTATGKTSGEFRDGHTGEIHAVAISEKRNLLLTGSADQTVRLWNLKTRELIVSMYFAGGEFVIWMPQGYYFSSDEGDNMIGWHVNQGADKEGRFIRAGQLKKYLWSPEMVRRAIILGSAKQAVSEMRPGVDNQLKELLQKRPPEFDIRLAADQQNVPDGFVAVEIVGATDAEAAVSEFAILAGGRNVTKSTPRAIGGDGKTQIVQIPVEEGENRIAITGYNSFGYLTERSVVALGKKKREEAKRGKLYVIAIGAEKYPLLPSECNGRSCDLRYPVDDAAEFMRVLGDRSVPLFSGMEALVFANRAALDEEPDQAAALDSLSGINAVLEPEADTIADEIKDFLDKPGENDTTILFVAGHGINVDEDYYFIPSDGRRDGDRWKRSSLVEWSDIQRAVERAEGTRFMLLDTCHAANSFNPRLEKDAADARIVVFSATAANSTAAELPELGHGVFTYSVLEGLRGAANTSGDGVRLLGLADYIYREVTRLTGSQQKPFYHISNMENILLARP